MAAFQKGEASRGNTKGTGLGLSISRSILELHKFQYGARNCEDGVIFGSNSGELIDMYT